MHCCALLRRCCLGSAELRQRTAKIQQQCGWKTSGNSAVRWRPSRGCRMATPIECEQDRATSKLTAMVVEMQRDELVEVTEFDWSEYFERVGGGRRPGATPDFAFGHVEASLESGVKEGMIVEIPLKKAGGKDSAFWLASVDAVYGPLIKLNLVGSDKLGGDVMYDLSKQRLYPLGWCQLNKIQLEPPEHIKKICPEWQDVALRYLEDVTYDTIPMHHIDGEGLNPAERLHRCMWLYVQDSQEPNRWWPAVIEHNHGGRLTLRYLQTDHLFTLFYLSPRLRHRRPSGASVICQAPPDVTLSRGDEREGTQRVPADLFVQQDPGPHKFEEGLHLEMIDPENEGISLERCVVVRVMAHSFVVQRVEKPQWQRMCSMHSTDIFPCGTLKSLRTVPLGSQAPAKGKVVQKRHFPVLKSAEEKGFECGQKLELFFAGRVRTADIMETKGHLLILRLDGPEQVILFRSVHAHDIFPLGWANVNQLPVSIPKSYLGPSSKPVLPIDAPPPLPMLDSDSLSSSSMWCGKVYFNYKCYSASFLSKGRLASLPKSIGPGSVQLVVREVINLLICSSFKSGSVLKRLEMKPGDDSVAADFVAEELKGKSRVLNLKARVLIPTLQSQVDQYLKDVCHKLGACPYLVSTTLYDDVCPADCQCRPKAEFRDDDTASTTANHQLGSSCQTQKPKPASAPTTLKRRRHPDTLLAETSSFSKDKYACSSSSSSNANGTFNTSDESDVTPSVSRATSPASTTHTKKQSRIWPKSSMKTRGAKLPDFRSGARVRASPRDPSRRSEARARQSEDLSQKKQCDKIKNGGAPAKDCTMNGHTVQLGSDPQEGVLQGRPIRRINLPSNPDYWTPKDTARFLAQTQDCWRLACLMLDDFIDGPAFLLLNYPTLVDHWKLDPDIAVKLCRHIESVRLAHVTQF